jgi:hypothetical protein
VPVTSQTSVYSSNSIRLSWREWAVALLVLLAALYLLPAACPAVGVEFSRPDYRLPTELSSDYWMFREWAQYSHTNYRAAVLGDSVMWGQYARSDDTLTHHLNSLVGGRVFANLGVDGLHPAAMSGMISYYGGALQGEPVLVHLNLLWMSSAEQDLSRRSAIPGATQAEPRFNHPQLVPQLLHRPVSYHPTPAEVIGAVMERHVPFLSWREHLKIAYYDGLALPEWTLDHPYALLPANRGPNAFSGDEPGSQPMTWQERGIVPQNLPWVEVAHSYQWRSFQRAVESLRSRRNRVFVLLGPFNTHALTRESETRYLTLMGEMKEWLQKERIAYYAPPALPTELYADASHPLGAGYRELAKELLESASFQEWLKGWARPPGRGRAAQQAREKE